jgi:hypothetical protein
MLLWVAVANAFGWGRFTGWGMAHGGFMIALPVCWVAANVGVFVVSRGVSGAWSAALRRSQRHW